ncbi:ABC transporter ATP-binding protein [Clostridium tagluense]|uniref:ABC transporter ATP-binding protein n=1 Tax=Clostridium tagluense TaxID=360422 RepID=UPI001C0C6430|nr:ABC transporter ATP-binding protein [Clostridium tagluense]MBU3127141.1 ABC transporter ATP-binding protein [Clostridium tagluense]
MSDIAIKVQDLSKVYKLYDKSIDRMKESLSFTKKKYSREYYALNNVSFEIKKGETVGIIGTNGSGKSTLLKIITGVLTPSMGQLKVNGKISALLELGAGFNPEYTGLENIYLNGTMMGYTREEMGKKVKPIMNFADIGEFINQPVKTYSSGMFARLAFAVAINVEPDILIVDEALSVGDTRFQIKCMDKMKQMMEGGTTVLFVSHDTNAIRRFCMKAIWINNGVMKEIGEVNRVVDKYLDFLKCGEIKDENVQKEAIEIKPFVPGDNIAEIIDFRILDRFNNEVNEVKLDEYLKIDLIYDVYDESIKHPVLGIALKSIDDDYVCGLNTLLDKISIPWEYGRNKFKLEYTCGLRATGGKYYFDIALFEETATVPIQYVSMIKNITIISDYIGEGRYIIPHVWRGNFE